MAEPAPNPPSTGLSSGQLAAAIAVPITVIILIGVAVGLYFYFRKRRAKMGSYKPNELEVKTGKSESRGTPNSVLFSQKERLF
ncbi:unnamed protein product [Rodentolepis nana]|uniref:4.1m domain-containing protein n=1 Tax=Rodentolepis nana TaxID=102285 RepID=A0A0R3TJM4_RODNA|nr:unnamed protein product [Rodentolepis nana]